MEGTPNAAIILNFLRKNASKIIFGTLLTGIWGCGSHESMPYPTYSVPIDSTEASIIERSNAYSDYLAASQELDSALGKNLHLLTKASFSPEEQKTIQKAAANPLRHFKVALQKVCRVPYAPAHSQAAIVGRAEWRLLVKVLIWRIQDATAAKSYGSAIQSVVLATKFGFDLSAGLPNDASLGLISVDDARQAIAPSIVDMNIGQLDLLSKSIRTVFLSRPPIGSCFIYAGKDSLQQVQDIQDIYRSQSLPELEKKIGSTAKEIFPILKELHDQSESKRSAFFEGFARDAKDETAKLKEDATLPVSARTAPAAAKPGVERPWKLLSRRLLGIGEPILKMNDKTCAKTQLLILESQVFRMLKTNGKTPKSLDGFSAKLNTDPYSGQPFVYQSDGTDFKLYSVGEDLTDNNGETDESYDQPDLMLERPR